MVGSPALIARDDLGTALTPMNPGREPHWWTGIRCLTSGNLAGHLVALLGYLRSRKSLALTSS
jgi:hypothetical protein